MKKTIIISYTPTRDVKYRDFGLFESERKIEVDDDFWKEYIEARYKFELMQVALENKIKKN